jgi:hypothetical protein
LGYTQDRLLADADFLSGAYDNIVLNTANVSKSLYVWSWLQSAEARRTKLLLILAGGIIMTISGEHVFRFAGSSNEIAHFFFFHIFAVVT